MANRVAQVAIETAIVVGGTKARLAHIAAEAAITNTGGKARVAQVAIETAVYVNTRERTTIVVSG